MNVMIQTSKTIGITQHDKLLAFANAIAKSQGLSFDKKDIVFNQDDFLKKIKQSENKVIIFDECDLGFKKGLK